MAGPATSPKKVCFVVGPIGAEGSDTRVHSDWLYQAIIKPAFAELPDFTVPVRADKISKPGMITTQVIEYLLDADLVIADLSLENPNAFYEIGIRHMAQRPIVHMQLKGEAPPFDVNGFRAIKFALKHPDDIEAARHELTEQVRLCVGPEYTVENPVTHARGKIRLEQGASPTERVLLDELSSIQARLSSLELEMGRGTSDSFAALQPTAIEVRHSAQTAEQVSRLRQKIADFLWVFVSVGKNWHVLEAENGTLIVEFGQPVHQAELDAICRGILRLEQVRDIVRKAN